MEIRDITLSSFPFIHHSQTFGLVVLQLPWFLVKSFDCIQRKLGEIKIEITGELQDILLFLVPALNLC